FDSAAEPMVTMDVSGTIVDANRAACERMACPKEELIGRALQSFYAADSANEWGALVARLDGSGAARYEGSMRDRRGEEFPVEVSAARFEFDEQAYVCAWIRDITERRRAEAALAESEARYRSLSELTSDYVCRFIVSEDGGFPELEWASGALQSMLGYTVEEYNRIGGQPALMHPDDADDARRRVAALLRGESTAAEFRVLSKDGRWIWLHGQARPEFDDAGRVVAILAGARDVTARKSAELALRQSEATLRGFFNADVAMGIVELEDGGIRLITVNDAAAKVLGSTSEGLRGTLSHERGADPKETELWIRNYRRCAEQGRPQQFEYARANGRWFIVTVCPISTNVSGQKDRFAFFLFDSTELRAAERRERLLVRELDHRVKNNLAVVAALVGRAARHAGDVDSLHRAIVDRIRAMGRAQSLVAKSGGGLIDLGGLMRHCLDDFMRDGDDAVSMSGLDVFIAPKHATTLGLIVRELITNAAKHGSLAAPEGSVEIEWKALRDADPTEIGMEWRESNGPRASKPTRTGFGVELITQLVQYDLGGVVEMRFEPEGLRVSMRFPLETEEAALTDGLAAAERANRV
ncbi:MAG: PAS domain S-box protein, partial [Planctomycetota bacterium]|nr:PAS domain S-box protein [Planctomycetota bacterium]